MAEIVTAVYENGILRPLEPLSLKEHQRIRIQLLPEQIFTETEQLIQALVDKGRLTPPPGTLEANPLSTAERQQLAILLGQAAAKPLSEIIIEDRGEW